MPRQKGKKKDHLQINKKKKKHVYRDVYCLSDRSLKKIVQKQVVTALRVRAFFDKTVRVCHVYCNFKIGFTCRITVIFGTLKDGNLLINTLASNICFG